MIMVILEVTNRIKGLHMIDRVPEERWTEETMRRQWQNYPPPKKKKEIKEGKRLSEEALPRAEKRREVKDKGEKERYTHLMQSSKE